MRSCRTRRGRSCGVRHDACPAQADRRRDPDRIAPRCDRELVGRLCGPSARKDFRKNSGGCAVMPLRMVTASHPPVATSLATRVAGDFSSHTAALFPFVQQRRTLPRPDLTRRPGHTLFGAGWRGDATSPTDARAGSARPARAGYSRTGRPCLVGRYRRSVAGRRGCSSSSLLEPGAATAAVVPGAADHFGAVGRQA